MSRSLVRCISVGAFAKQVFEDFNKLRPAHVSFSMFLAIAAKHYIDTHCEPVDIVGEIPNFYSDIESWKSEIKNMSPTEFIKLQQRHAQLSNIIKKEVKKKI